MLAAGLHKTQRYITVLILT